jgi:hypothetical protein
MRFLVVALLAALSIGYAQADPAPVNNNGQFQGTMGAAPYLNSPLGYCQFTVSGTAALLTAKCTVPANARVFYAIPETAAIRWRDDGVAPTASVGMPVSTGTQLVYTGLTTAIAAWQVIAQSGTSTVDVAFYQ